MLRTAETLAAEKWAEQDEVGKQIAAEIAWIPDKPTHERLLQQFHRVFQQGFQRGTEKAARAVESIKAGINALENFTLSGYRYHSEDLAARVLATTENEDRVLGRAATPAPAVQVRTEKRCDAR